MAHETQKITAITAQSGRSPVISPKGLLQEKREAKIHPPKLTKQVTLQSEPEMDVRHCGTCYWFWGPLMGPQVDSVGQPQPNLACWGCRVWQEDKPNCCSGGGKIPTKIMELQRLLGILQHNLRIVHLANTSCTPWGEGYILNRWSTDKDVKRLDERRVLPNF